MIFERQNRESQSRIGAKAERLLKEGHVSSADYFYFETRPDAKGPLGIVFGGHEVCEPDFNIRRNAYPYYILELGIRGVCKLTIDGREHYLRNSVLAGFGPESPHQYLADGQSGFEHYFIAFTGSQAQELFEKSTLNENASVATDKEIFDIFEKIIEHGLEKEQYSQQICTSYLRVLLLSLGRCRRTAVRKQSVGMKTYNRCRKYIDENFSGQLSPSQAASANNINVRYMSRLFKHYGNITPSEYILRLKFNKAANLLLTTSHDIRRIAGETGFLDPYHFSRSFKQFHGLSPQKYRKLHMEE